MTIDRRGFLQVAALEAATAFGAPRDAWASQPPGRIQAVAFDGLAVFDSRPVYALAEQLFPGRGTEIANAWRTRQFEYTWLRTVMNRYADFFQVTEEALVFVAKLLKLELTAEKRDRLLHSFLEMRAWADAPEALKSLRASGLRLALLSNFTTEMLDRAVDNSGLSGVFEFLLSTDRVRAFKPDPRAYQMGLDAFRLGPGGIAFVAFGGWDAAGAKSFGHPTFWMNRLGLPTEELGQVPDATGANFEGLVSFVLACHPCQTDQTPLAR